MVEKLQPLLLTIALMLFTGNANTMSSFMSQRNSQASAGWMDASLLPLLNNDMNSYAYWNCHSIPPHMTLCKNVGYRKMVLPNFFEQETLRDAVQQANMWVALVNTGCHADIQRFLCSLYAPVCLMSHQEAKIPPCWELCNEVRNACLPKMRSFDFDWPEIVGCDRFPKHDESMCISPQENKEISCTPCEQAITMENIASSFCSSEVVLRASIQDVTSQSDPANLVIRLSTSNTSAIKLKRQNGDFVAKPLRRRRYSGESGGPPTQHPSVPQPLPYTNNRHIQRSRIPAASRLMDLNENKNHTRVRPRQTRWLANVDQRYRPAHRRVRRSLLQRFRPLRASGFGGGRVGRVNPYHRRRRRRQRNLPIYDLDGINELILSCSTCASLSESKPDELQRQKWLVMGRRIKQEGPGDKYTNKVQVTFITKWNMNSKEFRYALATIRNHAVNQICNKNQATSPNFIQYAPGGDDAIPGDLKLLRSHGQPTITYDSHATGGLPNQASSVHSYRRLPQSLHRVNLASGSGIPNHDLAPQRPNHQQSRGYINNDNSSSTSEDISMTNVAGMMNTMAHRPNALGGTGTWQMNRPIYRRNTNTGGGVYRRGVRRRYRQPAYNNRLLSSSSLLLSSRPPIDPYS